LCARRLAPAAANGRERAQPARATPPGLVIFGFLRGFVVFFVVSWFSSWFRGFLRAFLRVFFVRFVS
jgi:hypothetical protein